MSTQNPQVVMYPIHLAIQRNNMAEFERLMNLRVDINVVDSENDTPLHYCIHGNRVDMGLLLLLEANIDVHRINNVSVVKKKLYPNCHTFLIFLVIFIFLILLLFIYSFSGWL